MFLQMQLQEIEEYNKRTALLNPRTRGEYIRKKREMAQMEEIRKQYYNKMRAMR